MTQLDIKKKKKKILLRDFIKHLVDKFSAQVSTNLFTYPQSKNMLEVEEDKNSRKINLKPNHFLKDSEKEGE
jgi:hypothetical protein